MEHINNKPSKTLYNELELFRKEHTVKKSFYLGKEWTYYSCGKGKDTIVILPGGLGTGEAAFSYIQSLEEHHKIISPIYPAVNTIDEMVEGLNKIIKTESSEHITLFGVSFGGILAQCYIKKYHYMIENLILAHTTTITSDSSEEELKDMIRLLNKTIKLVKILPVFIMRRILNMKFRRISKRMAEEEEFWRKYFKEIIKTYDKNSIVSSSQSMLDFIHNYKFEYGFLNDWQGRILILEADDDASFSDRQKELLKLLYKAAEVHSEHGYGHLTTFIRRDLYIKLIDDFVNF